MKRIRIDFVESSAWQFTWLITALIAASIGGYFSWQYTLASKENAAFFDQLIVMQGTLDKIKKDTSSKVDPRSASNKKAVTQVRQDLNKAFAVIEIVDVAGTRLTSFSVDTSADLVRVEYVLEQTVKATEITEALNSGYDKRPWQLDRVTDATPSGSFGSFQPKSTLSNVNAGWSAKMRAL
jgi:hypothetical protein